MNNKEIEIFCIAQTRINHDATRAWLDRCGASGYSVPDLTKSCPHSKDGCFTCLGYESSVTDAGALCGLCGKRCYMSFEVGLNPNITRIRRDWHEYLQNVLKSGHGSVMEHASWTFAIEGLTRVCTAELNRHRAGVGISEGSQRYIRFDDITWWMPLSIRPGSTLLRARCSACRGKKVVKAKVACTYCNDPPCLKCGGTQIIDVKITCSTCQGSGFAIDDAEFEDLLRATRFIFEGAFENMEKTYSRLCLLWGISTMKSFKTKKKLTSLFRRLIGQGVSTGGAWTFNLRALRHIIALRTSPGAEEEIAHLIGLIGSWLLCNEPQLMGDFERSDSGVFIPKWKKV